MQQKPTLPTLPMHLALSLGSWLSSPFALQCAKNGLLPWKPGAIPSEKNLQQEAKNRASEMLAGVLRYLDTPYQHNVPEPPVIWQKGNARLLDYGQRAANPKAVVLCIPSLINRYYILDLEVERSMLRYMASQGIYPLVMDWGVPGEVEKNFGVGDYITEMLLPAMSFVRKASGGRVALAGYCMGGVLALAAAQLAPKEVSSLALLATPWDFHCPEFAPFVLQKEWLPQMEAFIDAKELLPAELIQALFYITDPFVFEHKFRWYAGLEPDSRAAKDFLALERWVNDGVPMTSRVARDCLIGWAQENQVASGKWQVAGKVIDPRKIKIPTFIAIPEHDHVVPRDCATPLAAMFPKATLVQPGTGHVGMIVGRQAKRELWQPLSEFLSS